MNLDWTREQIPDAGTAKFLNLPETIKRILRLDKPDLIATVDRNGIDVPAVSIEITQTTPHGQHSKQRVARLVAAAEADVASICIIPNRKKAVVNGKPHMYNLGEDLYSVVRRIERINRVPVFIYHYPDQNGVLIDDPQFAGHPNLRNPETRSVFHTVDAIITSKLAGSQTSELYHDPWINSELQRIAAKAAQGSLLIDKYSTLSVIDTAQLAEYLADHTAMDEQRIAATCSRLPQRVASRRKTLVFAPNGRLFEKAGDPYCGMMAFFDYAFCRTGRSVEDRSINLMYMPLKSGKSRSITDDFSTKGYHNFWKRDSAFRSKEVPTVDEQFRISHELQYGGIFTMTKPLRIFGYFADLIAFRDALLVF